MIAAMHQPNYLPYLGFFEKMAMADILIIYDTALYSKQLGFHNRNRIKTPQGEHWLTVPVRHSSIRTLRDVQIAGSDWALRHRKTLEANYRRAPFYPSYADELHAVLKEPWSSLAALNESLIELVARWLSIPTKLTRTSELQAPGASDPTGKILHYVRGAGCDTYLSGAGGHGYLRESDFTDVRLEYDHFTPVPYPQLFGAFVPNLSALDAIFNVGEAAPVRRAIEAA